MKYLVMKNQICKKCSECKLSSDFYNNGKNNRSWCKKCLNAYQMDRCRAKKKKAVEILGGCCQKCGYRKNLASLDFHHLSGENKENNISVLKQGSWVKVVAELKKCTLLCRNCHGEMHHPHMAMDCVSAEATKCLNDLSPICSTGICPCRNPVYGTTYCSNKCRGKADRRVERPSSSQLGGLIKLHSWTNIGKMFGVSDNAVRKWAKGYRLI